MTQIDDFKFDMNAPYHRRNMEDNDIEMINRIVVVYTLFDLNCSLSEDELLSKIFDYADVKENITIESILDAVDVLIESGWIISLEDRLYLSIEATDYLEYCSNALK